MKDRAGKEHARRLFRKAIFCVLIFALLPCRSGEARFYKWVDDGGVVHFADNLGGVPPQYRDRVETGGQTAGSPAAEEDTSVEEDAGILEENAAGEGPGRFGVRYTPYGAGGERRVIIPVLFNGSVSARLAIDTGAPALVIFKSLAERLGILENEGGKIPIVTGGIGGTAPAIRVIVDSIQVGDALQEFVPTTVLLSSMSNAFEGLVGMDFMARYSMEIDPARQIVFFEEISERRNDPGGHDRNWWRRNFYEFRQLKDQWKTYLDELKAFEAEFKGSEADRKKIDEMKKAAYGWYREAAKMYDRLTWYASDRGVPLEWRR